MEINAIASSPTLGEGVFPMLGAPSLALQRLGAGPAAAAPLGLPADGMSLLSDPGSMGFNPMALVEALQADMMVLEMAMALAQTQGQQSGSSQQTGGGGGGSSSSSQGSGGSSSSSSSQGSGSQGGSSGSTDTSGIDASGSGAKAVELASSKLGQQSSEVKMDNYTAAGGLDNNCADFVSACIADAGLYKKQSGDASVATFKQHLMEQGYKTVDKAHAQPGDVAIFNGSQHTELVASQGATTLIGSNNGGTNVQHISKDSGNWGSVEYLHKA